MSCWSCAYVKTTSKNKKQYKKIEWSLSLSFLYDNFLQGFDPSVILGHTKRTTFTIFVLAMVRSFLRSVAVTSCPTG